MDDEYTYFALNGTFDNIFNYSNDGQPEFFGAYYSLTRFILGTILAVVGIASNLVAFIATNCSKSEKTLANLLFVNLVLANILTATLAWLCNNFLYLFEDEVVYFMQTVNMCWVTLTGLGACLFATMLGIISTLTLLGFAVNQYIAVNKPLHYTGLVTKRRVWLYLLGIWLLTLLASVAPLISLVVAIDTKDCTVTLLNHVLSVLYLSGNIGNVIIALVYVCIIGFCIRVYVDIHQHWKRLNHFRHRWELRRNWKAFITTALLVGSLTVFFLPYCILYFITLHLDLSLSKDHPFFVYIMNLLPYIKFITDPIIYGMRTKEVRDGYRRMIICCTRFRKKPKRTRSSLHYTSSFTTSIGVSSSPLSNLKMFD